jgi:hypothetical protein
MDNMDLEEPPAGQPAGPAAAVAANRDVKLPQFWTSRPAAWFTLAESRFRLRQVEDEQLLFDHLLSALGDDTISDVLDAIEEAAAGDTPYTSLKARLLETHVLSDFEKLEMLFACEPLGGRKPSQLLAAMLPFCPAGQEKQVIFHFMFLQRLPVSLRSALGDVQPGDPRALAARADRLLALNPTQRASIAAAVESEEVSQIAAVSSSGRNRNNRGRGGGRAANRGGGRGGGVNSGGGTSTAKTPTPSTLARESSGLCFFHWRFGEQANRCDQPCSWQGN